MDKFREYGVVKGILQRRYTMAETMAEDNQSLLAADKNGHAGFDGSS